MQFIFEQLTLKHCLSETYKFPSVYIFCDFSPSAENSQIQPTYPNNLTQFEISGFFWIKQVKLSNMGDTNYIFQYWRQQKKHSRISSTREVSNTHPHHKPWLYIVLCTLCYTSIFEQLSLDLPLDFRRDTLLLLFSLGLLAVYGGRTQNQKSGIWFLGFWPFGWILAFWWDSGLLVGFWPFGGILAGTLAGGPPLCVFFAQNPNVKC